jgi:hypothetical protein
VTVRTLSSDLLAAQQRASTEPRVDVVVENSICGLRRLEFTQLDSTSQTIARHDAAVAGDGSLTRVRMESGAVKQQRVANPGAGPWSSWSSLSTGMGTQVACTAKGARVVIVYTDVAGTGIKLKESTDFGATYGSEVAVATAAAAVADLAVAYKTSSGDLAIAWAAGTSVAIIKRTSGSFGSATSTAPGVSSINGIAMVYGADWDIVLTGVEVTTLKPSLWTIVYGDGNDVTANTWSGSLAQVQAESDAQVTYKAPSIIWTDAYRIDFMEADAFSGGNTRAYRTSLHPAMTFIGGAFTVRTPIPVNYGGAEGLALAADASGNGYVYETAPDAAYRAAQSQLLATLTPDVLAIDIDERGDGTQGFIDIDNSGGTSAGPPAPIAIGNLVAISWGYVTGAGAQSSRMADVWIAGYEYRRSGGVSVLRLHIEGTWELLRRSHQRAQIAHTADTYFAIVSHILSRAGMQLANGGASSRSTTVTPKFTIHAQTDAFDAAMRALSFVADRVRLRPLANASLLEPLASAASDYTFGTAHPLRSVRLRSAAPPVSATQAFGAGAFGEAIDFANAALGLGTSEQRRDASSTTGAAAAATAAAQLRQRALDAGAGHIIAPPNCGQEILDAVDFSDPLVAAGAVKRRVAGIRWKYDRRRAIYEQQLQLGAM